MQFYSHYLRAQLTRQILGSIERIHVCSDGTCYALNASAYQCVGHACLANAKQPRPIPCSQQSLFSIQATVAIGMLKDAAIRDVVYIRKKSKSTLAQEALHELARMGYIVLKLDEERHSRMLYPALAGLFPQRADIATPRRIVFIRPCCIGDVVMATAALSALRETFPQAHITWAIGSWSAPAIENHPALDAILDTGAAALPWQSDGGMLGFVRQLRAGNFDLALSLTRSPLMSLAVFMAGIPARAGLDSGGRGFGYNLRVSVDPGEREHEGAVYLRLISAIAGRDLHAHANVPVDLAAKRSIGKQLAASNITPPYIVAHPGGGSNPGMSLDSKRYPPARFAMLLDRVAEARAARLILIGGPADAELVAAVSDKLHRSAVSWVGELSFAEIAALAAGALCYIGNDSGLTHLAAAAGAATVMMMGPTDPARYAPFTPNHLALRRPVPLASYDLDTAAQRGWDWERDGISVDDAVARILDFLPPL